MIGKRAQLSAALCVGFFSLSHVAEAEVERFTVVAPEVLASYNVSISMRDGTNLSANIYRPDTDDPVPVIVVRTPYTKAPRWEETGRWWANQGYAFIIQDIRGRGDSEGKFRPFLDLARDGADTYKWASDQSWSSGRVGAYGGSYSAWTQLYPVAAGDDSLDAMMPMAVPPDPHRSFPVHNGVPVPAAAPWLASIDGNLYQDVSTVDLPAAYEGRPLISMDSRLGRDLPIWREWLTHLSDTSYWEERSYQSDLKTSKTPALYVTGWYDDVLIGALQNFTAMTQHSASRDARSRQWLIVGPWGHATNAGTRLGEIDFGSSAKIDMEGLQRRWFDYWLKGEENGLLEAPRVQLFVMGSNQWIYENEWPIARTDYTRFYLRGSGRANSLSGDGRLSKQTPPPGEPSDEYIFNPDDPVPYQTGLDSKQVGGPDDYSEIEKRDDLLVYTTEAFEESLRICGPVSARLVATSSAKDTDWTAKLLDVHPEGYAQRLTDGIVRARFRDGVENETLLIPGEPETYDIDLWATCTDILPGHRIRLEISSSAKGKFDVNLNTGGSQVDESQAQIAEQTVHHDAARLSYVTLPIVGEAALSAKPNRE